MGALGLLPDKRHLREQVNQRSNVVDHGIRIPKNKGYNRDDAEQLKKEMEMPSAWKIVEQKNEFRLKFDPKRVQEIHNAGVNTPYIPTKDNTAKHERDAFQH